MIDDQVQDSTLDRMTVSREGPLKKKVSEITSENTVTSVEDKNKDTQINVEEPANPDFTST